MVCGPRAGQEAKGGAAREAELVNLMDERILKELTDPEVPQRGGRGDSSPAIHDFVDPLVGYVDGISQLALGDAHRQQKLFQQHLA